MNTSDLILTIAAAVSILTSAVSLYASLKKPQEKLDKDQALDKKEADSKAEILAQQVQWQKEANEKKFSEMQNNLKEAMTLALNHTHTIEEKLDGHITNQNNRNETFSNQLTEIKTTLDLIAKKNGLV